MKTIDSIAGIKLTSREIDVIACAVGSKGSKRIAKILDISPRTVETHIQNISSKLSCNGQYGINDFIEQSEYLHPIKNHYLGLLMQYRLRTELKQVGSEIEKAKVSCYINSNIKDDNLENISKYLKIAKVTVLGNHDNLDIQELKVLTEEDIELSEQGQQFTNTVFICTKEDLKDSIDNFPKVKILDCTTVDHLCFSVFKILHLLAPAINLRSYEQEFTAAYKNLFPSNGEIKEPVEIENINGTEAHMAKNRIIKILAIIFGIIIIIFGTYFMKHKEKPQQISNAVEPVSYFVNHVKQVKLLEQNLAKYKKTSVVGVSGMGKTQLARMYVHENSKKYDIIWFFDCNLDINAEFLDLANAINKAYGAGTIVENAETSKDDVLKYLGSKDQWLLVFDNLKIGDNAKVKDLIEWGHNGHVIFGSQESTNLPYVVEVVAFAKQDSKDLARNILIEDNPEAVEFLAKEFKGYPILIVQGAQLLNHVKGLSFDEYKQKLQESSDKIKLNLSLVLEQLKTPTKDLLSKIALIDNQGFSKSLLQIISSNPESISDDIYDLIKFGLISNIDPNDVNPVFEMHDVIQALVASLNKDADNSNILSDMINKIVATIPNGDENKHAFFNENPKFRSNLEAILTQSEKYHVPTYEVLKLRSNLFAFYMPVFDYYNCAKMHNWLILKEKSKDFDLNEMLDDQKAAYASYKLHMGVYEDFANADFVKAFQYFQKAKEILSNINGHVELKFLLATQTSQTYAYVANVEKAEQNIKDVETILTQYPDNQDLDLGVYWYTKAKINLLKGEYDNAIIAIEKNIEADSKAGLTQDTFTAPTYVLQTEILCAMGKYEEAYVIIQRIADQELKGESSEPQFEATILMQLANAEAGVNKLLDAQAHIEKAYKFYGVQASENPKSATSDHATVFVIKGDILAKKQQFKEALQSYLAAENIYLNRYGEHFGTTGDIAYLLSQAAKSAYQAKDKDNFQKFYSSLVKYFGENHPNAVEIKNL